MDRKIYLDFNASTPIAPEAVEAMRPFLTGHYGNPSSLHWAGAPAKEAVERARRQVAGILGCHPTVVVSTSGGSEANNHAILGVFFANRSRGNHIVTTAVEHPATLEPCRFLERTLGARGTVLPGDRGGGSISRGGGGARAFRPGGGPGGRPGGGPQNCPPRRGVGSPLRGGPPVGR